MQAVTVAVADVYDTIKQQGIASLDRGAVERQATEDRKAENAYQESTLQMEIEQCELNCNVEAHQLELDRLSNEQAVTF